MKLMGGMVGIFLFFVFIVYLLSDNYFTALVPIIIIYTIGFIKTAILNIKNGGLNENRG